MTETKTKTTPQINMVVVTDDGRTGLISQMIPTAFDCAVIFGPIRAADATETVHSDLLRPATMSEFLAWRQAQGFDAPTSVAEASD